MFCRNCGSKINEGYKFCTNCGAVADGEQNINSSYINTNVQTWDNSDNKTNYAESSLQFSMWGIPLICLCGIGLLFGIPATICGTLAIKNKEADSAKAWIGLVVGILEVVGLFIIILAMIRSDG